MDFEDFKSFRRALIPSEVGSIPTRSRHLSTGAPARVGPASAGSFLWRALVAVCLVSVVPRAAASAPAAVDSAAVEYPAPHTVLYRSMAFPGWGQLVNGQPWKAALFMALEGGLAASGFVELRRSDRAFDASTRALARGDEVAAALYASRHRERILRARERFWWAGFSMLVGMIDAYIDAHLRDFVSVGATPDGALKVGIGIAAPAARRPGDSP